MPLEDENRAWPPPPETSARLRSRRLVDALRARAAIHTPSRPLSRERLTRTLTATGMPPAEASAIVEDYCYAVEPLASDPWDTWRLNRRGFQVAVLVTMAGAMACGYGMGFQRAFSPSRLYALEEWAFVAMILLLCLSALALVVSKLVRRSRRLTRVEPNALQAETLIVLRPLCVTRWQLTVAAALLSGDPVRRWASAANEYGAAHNIPQDTDLAGRLGPLLFLGPAVTGVIALAYLGLTGYLGMRSTHAVGPALTRIDRERVLSVLAFVAIYPLALFATVRVRGIVRARALALRRPVESGD